MAVGEFRPEPFTDFREARHQRAFQAALDMVQAEHGKKYPLIIGGERTPSDTHFLSVNPAAPDEVIGQVSTAEQHHCEQAMWVAQQAFFSWSRTEPGVRARILLKAAAILRRRRHLFSARLVLEVGKTWTEADVETAEAIDFLEFYAREMGRLASEQRLTRIPGEDNDLIYLPLGVGAVISPFNFPLAIAAGMIVSAAVTGNTVLFKPAVPAPVIGYHVVELLEEAGMPPGVVNYLPSSGSEVGQWMVSDPRTRFISFTGSRDVGVRIYEEAARVLPGQKWLKRVVAEMGGKDAIVVDRDADLLEAASGITASAFGYGGQKCSACSRAIIHQEVHDQVLEMVVEMSRTLKIGDPRQMQTEMGPLAGQTYRDKVLRYIDIGKTEGRLMCGGGEPPLPGGYFVSPTIFADVDPRARMAQEEIFGPVLAFHRAPDFQSAVEMANGTDYGLTGAVYSRNRTHIEYARREFMVGNLYINRKCTGALVGVHPFGGFNLSGTDSKAGGYDYLLLFTQAKSLCEWL